MTTPVRAHAWGGEVVVTLDTTTARQLAGAWAAAHTGDHEADAARPRWMDDVVALVRAAAHADLDNGHQPTTVFAALVGVTS